MSGAGEAVQQLTRWQKFKGRMGSGFKWSLIAGAGAMALAAAPFVISSIRNSRKQDNEPLPPAPELAAPMPQLITPEQMMMQQQQQMMQMQAAQGGGPTLGGVPLQEGAWVQRTRGGANGLDTSAPSITRPDGTNMIDGSQGVQELNAPVSQYR